MSSTHPATPTSRMVCAGCGAALEPDEVAVFRCPEARADDDVDHVLVRELDLAGTEFPFEGDPQPFVRFRELLHSYRRARLAGMSDKDWIAHARELDGRLAAASGARMAPTPFSESPGLAGELGTGSLWVKNETVNPAGSHKIRHLAGVALHLLAAAPKQHPRLAVASCGNAAIAAATMSRVLGWPLEAYVPTDADPAALGRLEDLGAEVIPCERDGKPGDPCYRAFLDAIDDGAVPFSCQGSANGLAIEGGATLAWEIVAQDGPDATPIDNIVVQVGGGALGSAVALGFHVAFAMGAISKCPRLFCVQTAGGHPLVRAWERLGADEVLTKTGTARALTHRSRYMTPWETPPHSIASGLLDDETYDWGALVQAMVETGGHPIVVTEEELARARDRARNWTSIQVDATGAAGLAGWARLCADAVIERDQRSVVLFTGGRR